MISLLFSRLGLKEFLNGNVQMHLEKIKFLGLFGRILIGFLYVIPSEKGITVLEKNAENTKWFSVILFFPWL